MKNAAVKLAAPAAIIAAMGVTAQAADVAEPVIYEKPVYHVPEVVPEKVSGWYIRGDIGYAWNDFRGADYVTYGHAGGSNHLFGDLKGSFSIGGGIGYQINHNFRTDVTLDYTFKTDFDGYTIGTCTPLGGGAPEECMSTDESAFDAWTVLANAYVDLGTYSGVTPYVGAGIGGAYVRWHDLENTIGPGYDQSGTVTHEGSASWRFAYALMAGVSIEATKKLAIDLGYRYRHIHQGEMFKYADHAGPGWDNGIRSHEVRAGLRYKLGGGDHYEPPYEPPYKPPYHPPKIYK
ncbi:MULTISPECIES: outer membrane protein [unclassified Roseitalea]|uniref:outer membrane protein n=1 Tax=unclassified Roseitalea TaxID=2639107 RepID=UPI00273E5C43|nr:MULTISPECIES: outer membrane protein [unclassified Roseitalea]